MTDDAGLTDESPQERGFDYDRTVALSDGDRIELGSVTMTYRVLRSLPSTVTRGS